MRVGARRAEPAAEVGELGERQRVAGRSGARGSIRSAGDADRGISVKGQSSPEGIITSGHDNKTARCISFHRGDPVNEPALTTMLRQIVANNRAGGWRKIKAAR